MVPPVQVSPLIKVTRLCGRRRVLGSVWAPRARPQGTLDPRPAGATCPPPSPRPALPRSPPCASDPAAGWDPQRTLTPPLTALSPQLGRYSALFLGVAYGAKRYSE